MQGACKVPGPDTLNEVALIARRVDRARRELWERRWVEETAEARAEREHEEPHAQVEAERGGRRGRGRTRVERRGRGQRILISSACPEQTDNRIDN